VQAEKKLDLWSLPELLVVHLKRFSYSRTSRDKLDAPVDFPLSNLDLSSFVLRQQVPPGPPIWTHAIEQSQEFRGFQGAIEL